jgi:hypothetical protein
VGDDAVRVRTPHGDLTLEEIAELLPGTGDIMASVATAWWRCAHAGRGGNWPLAAYYARRARGLLRKLAVLRPKYAGDLAAFDEEHVARVLGSCEHAERAPFDAAIDAAVARANELHAKWGKAYIRWRVPDDPPRDVDLGRAEGQAPAGADRTSGDGSSHT